MSLNVLGVITRALEILGQIPAGTAPSAQDAADCLVAMNAMKRAWFGTLIGPRLSPQAVAGITAQADNGGEYMIPPVGSPSPGTFVLTAPLNPRNGARFGVVDAQLSWGATFLTIQGNGRLIAGSTSPYRIAAAGANTRFWFRGDVGGWIVEGDWTGPASALEFPDPVIAYFPYLLATAVAADFGASLTPEVEAAALEGRRVLARTYGRRARAGPDMPIGLPQAAAG